MLPVALKSGTHGVQPNAVSPKLKNNCGCDETGCAAILSGMSCSKRKNADVSDINEDSLGSSLDAQESEPKRIRLETPKYTEDEQKRVVDILEREFDRELQAREDEALLIEERIERARRTLQYLCYAVVSDFYSREKTITQQVTSTRQRRIHPAVKQLLSGKHPKDVNPTKTEPSNNSHGAVDITAGESSSLTKTTQRASPKKKALPKEELSSTSDVRNETPALPKVPRYIPPKPKISPGKTGLGPTRGGHNKLKQRIVIGNVSKWLSVETREDSATHKWMVYVRGPKESPDVSSFVEKVRFFLHPSYRPNDVVQVVQAPFHLSRRGWGEFPVRVQIHFKDPFNKPVDIIHHLKLDRTCSGLQTLGAETVVDVWINKGSVTQPQEQSDALILSPVDGELDEIFPKVENTEDDLSLEPLLSSQVPVVTIKSESDYEPEQIHNSVAGSFEESFPETPPLLPPPLPPKCRSDGIKSEPSNVLKTASLSPATLASSPSIIPGKPVESPAVVSAGKSVSVPAIVPSTEVSPSSGTVTLSPSVVSPAKLVSSPSKVLILNRPGTVVKTIKTPVPSNPSTSNVLLNTSKVVTSVAPATPKNAPQPVNAKVTLSNSVGSGSTAVVAQTTTSSATLLQASVVSTSSPILKGVVSPNKLVVRNSSGVITAPVQCVIRANSISVPVTNPVNTVAPCVIKPNVVTASNSVNTIVPCVMKANTPRIATTNLVTTSSVNALGPCAINANSVQNTKLASANSPVPSVLKKNVLQNVDGSVVSANSSVPCIKTSTNSLTNALLAAPPTSTTQSLTTSQPSVLSPKSTQSNQNIVGRMHLPKTSNTASNPISFVRYKAPDGSIRLLQVSHINRPKAPTPTAVTSVQSEAPPLVSLNTPSTVSTSIGQAVIPPKPGPITDPDETASQAIVPTPKNPAPVVRLPAPSNVTPASKAPLLMFRDGKLYLIRPTGSGSSGHVPAANQNVSFVRQPSGQILVTRPPAPVTTIQTQNAVATVVNKSASNEAAGTFVQPTAITAPPMPMPALVKNTVRVIPTKNLMPDKQTVVSTGSSIISRPRGVPSVHRPGVSLLKSSVLQQSPTSSPICSPLSSPSSSPKPPTSKTITHRVVLPLPAMSSVSSSSHRTRLYKQMLSTVVRSCPTKNCAGGIGRAVRWMVRNLPLISSEARYEEYLLLHPYSAPDFNTFLGWNLGKQRACEWMRAKTVWRLLQDIGWNESDIWTTREILIWARFHGYTPGLPLSDPGSDVSSTSLEEVCKYKPIAEEVADWLDKREQINGSKTADTEFSDEEVDVISVNLSPSKVRVKRESTQGDTDNQTDPPEEMALENGLQGAGAFVSDALSSIGIQLEREQLVPGVLYPAAQRMLIQAVHSLVDDLVRRSLAEAWGTNIAKSPRSIEVANVCSAIISRPEFDFLSCAGLGIESIPSSTAEPSSSKTLVLKPS